jgi:TRAP transporter TAXI family solute receptor
MRKFRDIVESYWAFILLGLLALAILIVGLYLLGKRPPKEFTIATGREGGAYYTFAQIYRQRLAEEGYTLNIRETAGGAETIELLESGAVDAGFVQNTLLGSTPESGLSTLAAIYYEPLWIFYRDDLGAQPASITDLAGLRINIGEPGSATNQTLGGLLALNGIDSQNATLTEMPFGEAAERLKAGELDVVMMFAGARSAQINDLADAPGIRIMPIERAAAYTSRYKNLSEVVLPEGVIDLANDVPPEDTPLLAAQATLVAGPSLHPDLARLLLIVAADIHQQGGIFEAPNQFPSATFVGIPMNADAARYLENGPTFLENYLPLWLASRVERLLFLVLPALLILYPILRALPSASSQLIQGRIKLQYRRLFEIERGFLHYDIAQLDAAIAELESWQAELTEKVNVPVTYLDDLYNFRMHIEYALNRLKTRRTELEKIV